MPKLPALFDSFDNLDQIDINSLISWLKPVPHIIQLENYLANRILYPQALPLTKYDMAIDLAILREALRINVPKSVQKDEGGVLLGDNPFININLRKILIPERFLNFAPNLTVLTYIFVDAFLTYRKKADFFEDLWTVVLTDDADEIVGSLILPQFSSKDGEIEISILGKKYKIPQGGFLIIPCLKDRCEVSYKLKNGKVLGKEENALELYGGKLGIIIDGRVL